jgi:hypothetical protein
LHPAHISLIPFIRTSLFPFYGWESFEIRLARRRAHPCDEQGKVLTCSFCALRTRECGDSILSGGCGAGRVATDVAAPRGEARACERPSPTVPHIGEAHEQLYKYNGNLLHLSAFSSSEIIAGGTDFRWREILVRVRKPKIRRRKYPLSAGGGSPKETKRSRLLQYLRYGQLSHWFGDFRADFVTRCVAYSLNRSRQPSTCRQAWSDASFSSSLRQ